MAENETRDQYLDRAVLRLDDADIVATTATLVMSWGLDPEGGWLGTENEYAATGYGVADNEDGLQEWNPLTRYIDAFAVFNRLRELKIYGDYLSELRADATGRDQLRTAILVARRYRAANGQRDALFSA